MDDISITTACEMTNQKHATKQQHWVPQFYLKGWSFEKDQVNCFDKTTRKGFSPKTTGVSGSTWFYDTETTRDQSDPETFQIIEKLLAKLEGKCAPLFESLRSEAKQMASAFSGVAPDEGLRLTQQQRADISAFMSLQFLRTDDVRAFIRTSMNAIVQEGMEATLPIAMPEVDPSKYKMTVKEDEIKRLHLVQLLGFPEYAPYFLNKWWNIGVNPHSVLLITSDNPIVKIPAIQGEDGLDSYGIRLVYPISPHLVFTLYDVKFFPPRFQGLGFLTEETVKHYNLLQLQQCRRQIYSAQNDFGFAKNYSEENSETCLIDNGKMKLARPLIDKLVSELVKVADNDKENKQIQKGD